VRTLEIEQIQVPVKRRNGVATVRSLLVAQFQMQHSKHVVDFGPDEMNGTGWSAVLGNL
jgi:hypothetical protein